MEGVHELNIDNDITHNAHYMKRRTVILAYKKKIFNDAQQDELLSILS